MTAFDVVDRQNHLGEKTIRSFQIGTFIVCSKTFDIFLVRLDSERQFTL